MSTLGKILLFVNILLAFGVLYLASQDYAKRRQLNENAVKYEILFDGLPVDAIKDAGDIDAESLFVTVAGPNMIATTKPVSKKVVDSLFTGVDTGFGGSGTPKNQIEEVDAVFKKLTADLDGKAPKAVIGDLCGEYRQVDETDAQGRVAKITRFVPGKLMTLAHTFDERAEVKRMGIEALRTGADLAALAKNARDRLKNRFDAVSQAPNSQRLDDQRKQVEDIKTLIAANPNNADAKKQLLAISNGGPTGPTGSDAERRLRIAQLLMGLNPSPNWQKRVALTVGLKTYQLAITEQTSRLEAMATQTRDIRFSDQQSHDAEYEQLASFALENSKLVDQQQRVVDALTKVLAEDQSLFETRTRQLADLKNELGILTAAVNKKLTAQKQTEKDLFAVQREVGLTLRETGKLEGDLRAKEAK